MTKELKPCPFCGGEVRYIDDAKQIDDGFVGVFVCSDCKSVTYWAFKPNYEWTMQEKAALCSDYWNRRS